MIHTIITQLGTKEFYSNLAAEFTGLLFEILILTITIPLIIHIYNCIKYRQIQLLLRIDILRLYEKLTSAIVDFVLGTEKFHELTNLTCDDTFKYISNHEYYGQLDNNLLLITNKITSPDITDCIKKATPNKLNEFVHKFRECSLSFDRLISLLSFMPKKQSELYTLRQNFIIVEEIFTTYLKKKQEVEDPDPFISLERSGQVVHLLGMEIDHISKKDRKKVNLELRNKKYIQFVKLLPTFLAKKFQRKK